MPQLPVWNSVKPGDIHTVNLDRLMSNDGTTHLTVDMYNNQLKHPHIADAKKLVFIVDHNVPSDSPKTAASQKKMRDFARENGIDFWEGKGVCHQIMMENYVRPGELIFGADSHTCSYGALSVHLVPVSDVQISFTAWSQVHPGYWCRKL